MRIQLHVNRCSGFTLVELLVVIALISALVGFLLPAIQTVRETNAATAAENNLNILGAAATAYHVQVGQFPASLSALANFCSQNPTLCTLDAELAAGKKGGYIFYTGASGGVWSVQAEPVMPGITASKSMLYELSRSNGQFTSTLTRRLTPGADIARKEVMDRIFAEGAQTVGELFALSPDATLEARSFVEAPTSRDQVFALIDKNVDGQISLNDIYEFPGAFAEVFDGVDPALQEPLRTFLNKVSLELKLQTMTEETAENSAVGVGILRSMDGGQTWFTLDGLCHLTNLHVSDKKVASDLCKTLTLADAAKQRGDLRTRDRLLAQYFSELEQQAHITITRKNITMMVWLTVGFFEVRGDNAATPR
jgi:prepilin-type N-terminal cleavage/methylation domain-containing protein